MSNELFRSVTQLNAAIVACEKCPRLRTYCAAVAQEKRRAFREQVYWGKPLPGFGDAAAHLLMVGLAPAAHGGNRTGRMFTGDRSGDFPDSNGFCGQPRKPPMEADTKRFWVVASS